MNTIDSYYLPGEKRSAYLRGPAGSYAIVGQDVPLNTISQFGLRNPQPAPESQRYSYTQMPPLNPAIYKPVGQQPIMYQPGMFDYGAAAPTAQAQEPIMYQPGIFEKFGLPGYPAMNRQSTDAIANRYFPQPAAAPGTGSIATGESGLMPPDAGLRAIQLKQQAGQPLTGEEFRRLAQRQWTEQRNGIDTLTTGGAPARQSMDWSAQRAQDIAANNAAQRQLATAGAAGEMQYAMEAPAREAEFIKDVREFGLRQQDQQARQQDRMMRTAAEVDWRAAQARRYDALTAQAQRAPNTPTGVNITMPDGSTVPMIQYGNTLMNVPGQKEKEQPFATNLGGGMWGYPDGSVYGKEPVIVKVPDGKGGFYESVQTPGTDPQQIEAVRQQWIARLQKEGKLHKSEGEPGFFQKIGNMMAQPFAGAVEAFKSPQPLSRSAPAFVKPAAAADLLGI